MAEEQDSLIRQIDEEMRRERLAQLWDKYGVLAIGVVAAILIGFGGWRIYLGEAQRAAQRAGAQYAEASRLLADKKAADAVTAFNSIATSGPAGYAQLAKLRLAANAREGGRVDEAIAHYRSLADQTSADPLFRAFAKLQIAALKVDTASFTDIKNQLNGLLAADSPWRHDAQEILGLAAYRGGDMKAAREAFQALMVAKDVPQEVVQRAQLAMALITREELRAKKGATPSPGGSDTTEPAKTDGAATTPNEKSQ